MLLSSNADADNDYADADNANADNVDADNANSDNDDNVDADAVADNDNLLGCSPTQYHLLRIHSRDPTLKRFIVLMEALLWTIRTLGPWHPGEITDSAGFFSCSS